MAIPQFHGAANSNSERYSVSDFPNFLSTKIDDSMLSDFLKLSDRIWVLPVIHGSGDFAIEVRRVMLAQEFDCLAVPLPPSFQEQVEEAVAELPNLSLVVQPEPLSFESWQPDETESDDEVAADAFASESSEQNELRACSYVPIDPCQPVIAALRIALQERMPRAFIDLETANFVSLAAFYPDSYPVKQVSIDRFAAALMPTVPRVPEGQPEIRVVWMANRLRELERQHPRILFVCSMMDWPWIKDAYHDRREDLAENDDVEPTETFANDPLTHLFWLGELPFITGLYEQARQSLDDDENLSIDGVKALLLATRDRYRRELKSRARKITPKTLRTFLHYVRNLCLIERRMTPDLYSLILAAKQIAGDQFAITLAEVSREYGEAGFQPATDETDRLETCPMLRMTNGIAQLPDGDVVRMKSRLPGQAIVWRSLELKPKAPKIDQDQWRQRWNPFHQCSWPEEDVAIEKFRTHVKEAALAMLGADLVRTEKFSTSLKDGLDIRETLRNFHTGELYVKVCPPTRGTLDCVLMFFDSPADPRDYPWRITWMAEHHDESTLALFATDFGREMVGPGIGAASYGGAMFLFPPRPIPEVWSNPQFDFTDTMEERLLAAACVYSGCRHIAVLSESAPGPGWRRLAKKHGKKLIHVPLGRFSQETIQQLRIVHVLNGKQVRSYAAHFIRKA
ncbi:hypothetical protein LBMAG52_37950 [Planctomycetia bacterium]|nr:hypothetical protein LBMAG52_37950 [Planctomycetia bacterium]